LSKWICPSAYLNDANTDLTVRYLTDTDENSQVPLRFKAGKDGDYTLSIGSESAYDVLFLEDKRQSDYWFKCKSNIPIQRSN
jgi:hypothetical protein